MTFFKNLIKKFKCDHDYQKIDTDFRVYPNYTTHQYEMAKYYILYCGKCDKEKRVHAERYERNLTKQQIRKQYE